MPTYGHENYVLYDISAGPPITYTPQGGAIMVTADAQMTEQPGGGDDNSTHEDGEIFEDDQALGGDFEWNGTFTDLSGNVFHVYINTLNPAIAMVASDTPDASLPGGVADYPASITEPQLVKTDRVFCFGPDTDIETATGPVKVQDLAIGDMIMTPDGGEVAVLWIGRQEVRGGFAHRPELEPVRIKAGALGDGLPCADLTVSSDHGMVVDGLLINASALVNGDTIAFVPLAELPERFTYYHIETATHDVILANGAASETFIDIPGRSAFDNYQEYLDLYGAERIIREMNVPRITSKRLVPTALKARLGLEEPVMDFSEVLKSA